MTDAPERIWAASVTDDGWRWPVASKFPMQGYPPNAQVEYRRADLPPKAALPTIDELAQIIRRVDGNHDLGADALAEAILAALVQP